MTSDARHRPAIVGRDDELAVGDRFLEAIETRPASLFVEGEPGIGKTTVWTEIAARARGRGHLVLISRPERSEVELPFAGLMDLVGDRADLLAGLPKPQRRALEIALVRAEPDPTETVPALATSAAFLSILTLLAAESPVVVAIDDLQWLDPATLRVVGFAARRLGSLRVGLLAAVRVASALDPSVPRVDVGVDVERIALGPLPMASLYHVVERHLGLSLQRSALMRIDAASGGNPILALELARAGGDRGFAASDGRMPIPSNVTVLVSRRVSGLPEATRRALLRCSALARPTVELVSAETLQPAVDDGLVTIEADGRIRFAHPLFASAVYSMAPADRRAEVHCWISKRVDDPDERTRHADLASTKRDARLAGRLHEAAERARQKGAPEAAAELEERAVARTPLDQRSVLVERQLRAAEHHERAGDIERGMALANEVLGGSSDAAIRARAHWLIAEIAYGQSFGAAIRLLEAATQEPGADPAQVAQLELHLSFAHMALMDLAKSLAHVRRAENLAASGAEPGLVAEILASRVYIEMIKEDQLDRRALRRSLALEDPHRESPIQVRPTQFAATIDMLFGRLDRARSTLDVLRIDIVESGEDHELPYVLDLMAFIDLLRGDRTAALAQIDEAFQIATLVGSETLRGFAFAVRAVIAAFQGDTDDVRVDVDAATAIFDTTGWGVGRWYALKALAHLALSRGEYDEVERVLGPACEGLGAVVGYAPVTVFVEDLIDARIATGDLGRAERLIAGLESAGRSVDSPMARAVGARGRALLESARSQHDAAKRAITDAEHELDELPIPSERARTLLAKGQILRRERQKRAAGEALAAARAIFMELEMPLWVAKTDAELARLGLRHGGRLDLTETERSVAELAATGLTNRQIAAQVFLTRKTVEDVMSRVYGKLGIGSRAELGAWLARQND
jgi:DNA-binding CsgD family transcriptional regulator